jgi:hypothetical protein
MVMRKGKKKKGKNKSRSRKEGGKRMGSPNPVIVAKM